MLEAILPRLSPTFEAILEATGLPYVLEADFNYYGLCGVYFGTPVLDLDTFTPRYPITLLQEDTNVRVYTPNAEAHYDLFTADLDELIALIRKYAA